MARPKKEESSIQKVSSANTKDQILSAYKEVLAQLEAKECLDPNQAKLASDQHKLIEKVAGHTADTIVSNVSRLKMYLIKQLDELGDKLITEFDSLRDIQSVVKAEKDHIQELYNIKESANSLSALLLAQQEEKEKFDLEIQEKKAQFDLKLAEKENAWADRDAKLKSAYDESKERLTKERARDEEEYTYALELARRKEADEYQARKQSQERKLANMREELEQRETHLKEQEETLQALQADVDKHKEELDSARKQTENSTREQLEQRFSHERALAAKEVEGHARLQEQTIKALQNRIKEQEMLITQLTSKADSAVEQIQTIACRALDSSSQRFAYTGQVALHEEKKKRDQQTP